MTDRPYEHVTVRCLYCDTERTVGKYVEDDLPEWVCGPCKREMADDERELEVSLEPKRRANLRARVMALLHPETVRHLALEGHDRTWCGQGLSLTDVQTLDQGLWDVTCENCRREAQQAVGEVLRSLRKAMAE